MPGVAEARRRRRKNARGHSQRGDLLARQPNSPISSSSGRSFAKRGTSICDSDRLRRQPDDAPEAAAWLLDMARDKIFDIDVARTRSSGCRSVARSIFDQLSTLYDQSKGDTDFQDHLLFIYSQRREPAAVDKLMAIAKSDPNIERRKQALFWLGQKNDPRVKQFHPRPDQQ